MEIKLWIFALLCIPMVAEAGPIPAVLCPILRDPQHGKILQPDRTYGAKAATVCDDGYVPTNPEATIRYCQGDNNWGGRASNCTRNTCPTLESVENGILSTLTGKYRAEVNLQCNSGYVLNGVHTVTCEASGQWDVDIGKCIPGIYTNLKWIIGLVTVGLTIFALISATVYITNRLVRRQEGPSERQTLLSRHIKGTDGQTDGSGLIPLENRGLPEELGDACCDEPPVFAGAHQPLMAEIQTKGGSICRLRYNDDQMTADELERLKETIHQSHSLEDLEIHKMPSNLIQPLAAFITRHQQVNSARFGYTNDNPSLEVLGRQNKVERIFYLNKDHTLFQQAGMCLREELSDFLKRYSIPSAVSLTNSKLGLFMTKEQEDTLSGCLHDRLDNIRTSRGDLVSQYEIIHLNHNLEVFNHEGYNGCSPGCRMKFECSGGVEILTTAGAFVKGDGNRRYILSSAHGKDVYHCYFIGTTGDGNSPEEYETEYVEGIYSSNPLFDACLVEIDNAELREKLDPYLPGLGEKNGLSGPYKGPLEDLNEIMVMKYGGQTKLTKGSLSYHGFELPKEDITDGLMVIPADGSESFAEEGDSGSIVFRETSKMCQEGSMNLHEALAMHCKVIKGFKKPHDEWCLAFRLDDVLMEFNKRHQNKLKLLPIAVNE